MAQAVVIQVTEEESWAASFDETLQALLRRHQLSLQGL